VERPLAAREKVGDVALVGCKPCVRPPRCGAYIVAGTVELDVNTELVMPGDSVTFTVTLNEVIALQANARFAIREGNRTVGSGFVTRILE
jgi:translation elongation factor EF-Tu-like GTPase